MARSILIVDDHPGFRAQARRLLDCEGYRVIGEAVDCGNAYDRAVDLAPEVVLVDVNLPDGNGFELARKLSEIDAAPLVILTSSRDAAELEPCVSASPVRGFIPKAELSRTTIENLLP